MSMRGNLCHLVIVASCLFSGCSKSVTVIGIPERPMVRSIGVSSALHDAAYDVSVAVTGVVKDVCPDDGCWIVLTDRANILRIEPDENVGEVPGEWRGRSVRVDGRMMRKIILPSSKGYAEYEKLCEGTESTTKPTVVLRAQRIELMAN
jgi:hypothetical protein